MKAIRALAAALASGYKRARDCGAAIAAVMAGDGQMDPEELFLILDPVVLGEADFCKGNRFINPASRARIPKLRLAGNLCLSFLTRHISGYRHINDTQNGYTAANRNVLETLDWDRLYKKYGQPNDLLVKLSLRGFRIAEIPNTAIYHASDQSKMNIARVFLPISWLILRLALQKMLALPVRKAAAKC